MTKRTARIPIVRWCASVAPLVGAICAGSLNASEPMTERPTVIAVVGADGTPEYGAQFRRWADRWKEAATKGNAEYLAIGREPATAEVSDRERLRAELQRRLGRTADPLWLVLIGHGTFDGKTARFNLRGPDITPGDLREWLQDIVRPTAIVDCSACSGPFLAELSGPARVVITATKTGQEYNFARFGEFLSASLADPAADLDKDEQTSLLEAYVVAGARLREAYAHDARLVTEHPLLDDNGDRLGTPADWFQGLRPIKAAKAGAALDGALARQLCMVRSRREESLPPDRRTRRDALERELAGLRAQKQSLGDAEYLAKLESLLVPLARLYAE